MIGTCPGCGEGRDLGAEAQPGAVIACTWCAGGLFRLGQQGEAYVLQEVPQASCPQCEARQLLPDTVQSGDTFMHCNQTFVVSYAYGAYALEPLARHHAGHMNGVTEQACGRESNICNSSEAGGR